MPPRAQSPGQRVSRQNLPELMETGLPPMGYWREGGEDKILEQGGQIQSKPNTQRSPRREVGPGAEFQLMQSADELGIIKAGRLRVRGRRSGWGTWPSLGERRRDFSSIVAEGDSLVQHAQQNPTGCTCAVQCALTRYRSQLCIGHLCAEGDLSSAHQRPFARGCDRRGESFLLLYACWC